MTKGLNERNNNQIILLSKSIDCLNVFFWVCIVGSCIREITIKRKHVLKLQEKAICASFGQKWKNLMQLSVLAVNKLGWLTSRRKEILGGAPFKSRCTIRSCGTYLFVNVRYLSTGDCEYWTSTDSWLSLILLMWLSTSFSLLHPTLSLEFISALINLVSPMFRHCFAGPSVYDVDALDRRCLFENSDIGDKTEILVPCIKKFKHYD